jgi:hypothetical protein
MKRPKAMLMIIAAAERHARRQSRAERRAVTRLSNAFQDLAADADCRHASIPSTANRRSASYSR